MEPSRRFTKLFYLSNLFAINKIKDPCKEWGVKRLKLRLLVGAQPQIQTVVSNQQDSCKLRQAFTERTLGAQLRNLKEEIILNK